jgi:hypothetical protein
MWFHFDVYYIVISDVADLSGAIVTFMFPEVAMFPATTTSVE